MKEEVNHPKHYNSHPSGIECIEIVRHHNFNIGNAIKYLWRQGLKISTSKSVKSGNVRIRKKLRVIDSAIRDLESAKWYINDEISQLNKKREELLNKR